ncbi:YecA family protein [Pseudoduganella rhizocola]|uniref:YecA family protein n=1 Tax=Pseudoduganella rhizocola TaxID=3382643 RepID=UPI0038B5523E
MAKVGRNDACPCGSGAKFKRCHGRARPAAPAGQFVTPAQLVARNIQRERQQGLGRPIISGKLGGRRLVAVKNKILYSDKWKTFHDFLFDFIKRKLDPDWGTAEIAKPLAQRHPILIWYDHLCRAQQAHAIPGKISSMEANGAAISYLRLAYDLYSMEHNSELQAKLINRLKHPEQFLAARYELFVAATMIRAGYAIVLEDEDDRTSSHCEFTATHTATGRQFSVEAKCRNGANLRPGRQLQRALAKRADHERIVFIELAIGQLTEGEPLPRELQGALQLLRRLEGGTDKEGNELPPAYVFLTNSTTHLNLESVDNRSYVIGEGFQIPDFKLDGTFPTFRALINAREKDRALTALLESARDHAFPPVTFDGEIAEYALGVLDPNQRLIIGRRYQIDDGHGRKRLGLLTSATVAENESKLYGAMWFDDNTAEILKWDMSEAELDAWRRHADTFFGEPARRSNSMHGPLELYDFFHNGYKNTPRERLLELLHGAPDLAQLEAMSQPELVSIYAERITLTALANMPGQNTPNAVLQNSAAQN